MKGFFSFVLLLSLILLLLNSFNYSNTFSSEELILTERIYQLEMNLKENIYEGAREGAAEGIAVYTLSHPDPETFNLEQAKEFMKLLVHEKISALNSLKIEDFEFQIWCGDPSSLRMENLKKKMLQENKILICEDCKEVMDIECMNYIEPEFILDIEFGETPNLASITLGNKKGFFGISIYSEKFQISSVFPVPKKEVNLIEYE